MYQSKIISHNGFHTLHPTHPSWYITLQSPHLHLEYIILHTQKLLSTKTDINHHDRQEQQKILHKICSTPPVVTRMLVHDYTSQRRDVLGMIPLLCGLDGSGILAKRAKTSMRVRVDRGWWMDVDWRAQYGARTETMETRGDFYATAVSWVMLEQSFIFESIAPSRYAMFSAHFR